MIVKVSKIELFRMCGTPSAFNLLSSNGSRFRTASRSEYGKRFRKRIR